MQWSVCRHSFSELFCNTVSVSLTDWSKIRHKERLNGFPSTAYGCSLFALWIQCFHSRGEAKKGKNLLHFSVLIAIHHLKRNKSFFYSLYVCTLFMKFSEICQLARKKNGETKRMKMKAHSFTSCQLDSQRVIRASFKERKNENRSTKILYKKISTSKFDKQNVKCMLFY